MGRVSLTDAQVRWWLLNYYQHGHVSDPVMRDLLRLHGRPHYGSPLSVTTEARKLLDEKIEALRPLPGAPTEAWVPYRALQGYKSRAKIAKLAADLHVSPRSVSRARALGLSLLRAELETPG